MTDDLPDVVAPSCPRHLEPLLTIGEAEDGRDARWVCPVDGCDFVAVA